MYLSIAAWPFSTGWSSSFLADRDVLIVQGELKLARTYSITPWLRHFYFLRLVYLYIDG
jgi:hypothetical protein